MNNLKQYFYEKGLDIVTPFLIKNLDSKYQKEFMGFKSGVLLGNSKYFWKVFIKELGQLPSFSEDPLDRYIETECSKLSTDYEDCKIIFSHQKWREDNFFPFQDFTHSLNLAKKTKHNLLFHFKYGYWFSLRAIILFKEDNFELVDMINHKKISCTYSCEENCEKWYEVYKNSLMSEDHINFRKSCPYAKDYQFTENQIQYHYFQNIEILRKEIRKNDERL